VLASIFASRGAYESATSFNDGMTAAAWVGAIVVATAALAALTIPGRRRVARTGALGRPEPG
jgi:hypothetical protein